MDAKTIMQVRNKLAQMTIAERKEYILEAAEYCKQRSLLTSQEEQMLKEEPALIMLELVYKMEEYKSSKRWTKYYAPESNASTNLVLATHPGKLTENDVIDNIMVILQLSWMTEEEGKDDEYNEPLYPSYYAEDAIEAIGAMGREEYHELWERATWLFWTPEVQQYLYDNPWPCPIGMDLHEVDKDSALELLGEFTWRGMEEIIFSAPEWD